MSQYGYRFGSVWRPPRPVAWLAGLLPTLGIVALQGGIAMLIDRQEPMGLSIELLSRTPIDDYFLPGLFLLAIAAAALVTTVGIVFGWRWHRAEPIERRLGRRWPWIGTVATASVLLVFELFEVYLFPFHPILHPLLIAWTVAILVLAFSERTRDHFWTPPIQGKVGPAREHLHERH
ncbi:MAG: hypothetical protein R3246_05930 [Acidimicrobiia bacterium]|nr:hypothetical protein [Acidimicrobiia bacterium]